MSEVRVNNIVDYGGKGAPTFDNGAVISGVSSLGNQAKIGSNVTITSGGINVSGVTTAATLSGNLTGDVSAGFLTATSTVIGSGVTINAGGLNITGVCTATTFEGSGASMTGVAMSITPLSYNPDVNDGVLDTTTGIGITFDHRIIAGSGNVTLSIATNAGAAGTTVENFGVGSSVTIQGRKVIIDPTSDLNNSETYHISYPSGCFTNTSGDVSYVGTAYTFGVKALQQTLWAWGASGYGDLAQNNTVTTSSPVQIPGTTWSKLLVGQLNSFYGDAATKTDNTLWTWGYNDNGHLGHNSLVNYSSPVQVPGTTWNVISASYDAFLATKTDGTLWSWGKNSYGSMGVNNRTKYSSPVQVPGSWATGDYQISSGAGFVGAIKTNGTLWTWGRNTDGKLGHNNPDNTHLSSPVQIPGTTWRTIAGGQSAMYSTKTDGTLWAWGGNGSGGLGQNNTTSYSSPIQIPGTTWGTNLDTGGAAFIIIPRTDGTLWAIGSNNKGQLGVNNTTNYSSPIQIPGTTWKQANCGDDGAAYAVKTDGTTWAWGYNDSGQLGHNNRTDYSSPTQIPGTTWNRIKGARSRAFALQTV